MRLKQVVLPAPLGPMRPRISPARHRKGDAGQGLDPAEGFTQTVDFKHGKNLAEGKGEKGKGRKANGHKDIQRFLPLFPFSPFPLFPPLSFPHFPIPFPR